MTPHEKSKPLHTTTTNTNIMSSSLPSFKWGSTKFLRCVKPSDHTTIPNQHVGSSQQSKPTNHDSLKNPKTTNGVSKRVSFLVEDANNQNHIDNNNNRPIVDDPSRPWNLRTRRAACKAPLDDKKAGLFIHSPRRNHALEIDSPTRNANCDQRQQLQSNSGLVAKERLKFSVSLSKEEIEEDFLEMMKIRPPRRPKKRPRTVQKYLDTIFPGLWLSEVTADIYKVPELPES